MDALGEMVHGKVREGNTIFESDVNPSYGSPLVTITEKVNSLAVQGNFSKVLRGDLKQNNHSASQRNTAVDNVNWRHNVMWESEESVQGESIWSSQKSSWINMQDEEDKENVEPEQEEGNLRRDKMLSMRPDQMQEEMRDMHLQITEAIENNARMLDAHEENLKNIKELIQHFKSNPAQEHREVFVENEETNREDSEPCLVVTLRSGKKLGTHKIRS